MTFGLDIQQVSQTGQMGRGNMRGSGELGKKSINGILVERWDKLFQLWKEDVYETSN